MEAVCPLANDDEGAAIAAEDGEEAPLPAVDEFELHTIPEGVSLATALARAFPDPDRAVIGLTELLVNAVEHGNLGITYEEKATLLEDGELAREIERRASRPDLGARRVKVTLKRTADRIITTIEDEGSGFDWRAYVDYDPARLLDPSGRGIAIARATIFDNLVYNDRGNVVIAEVHTGPTSGTRVASEARRDLRTGKSSRVESTAIEEVTRWVTEREE
jgi:sigma-B regulation protein RsbU (phosphoserine phosphatase)